MMIALLLVFTACQEDVEIFGRGDKTVVTRPEGPGDKAIPPGGLPYPEITEWTHVSEYTQFGNYRTRNWRIEWPEYNDDVNVEMIPSLFSIDGGTLNSINYLNSIHPSNKAKLDFSLYYDNKLTTPHSVGEIWHWNEDYTAEKPRFVKYNVKLDDLKDWVTKRPAHFATYYKDTNAPKTDEVSYEEGDVFLMWLTDRNLYGGIRIVSESPRIIEVYVAEEII